MAKTVELILFIAFGVAAVCNQIVFWAEIEPTLRRLGYKYDVLSLRKYPNGVGTLWEYKKSRIAEQKPLKQWWFYWSSLWLMVLLWVSFLFVVFLAQPQ